MFVGVDGGCQESFPSWASALQAYVVAYNAGILSARPSATSPFPTDLLAREFAIAESDQAGGDESDSEHELWSNSEFDDEMLANVKIPTA
jgi:hypothetical protein